MSSEQVDVRPSPIAGTWYPGTETELRRAMERFFADEGNKFISPVGDLLGLVVPHAGYYYSGACAAAAFQALRGKNYQKVIIISPSHRAYTAPLLTSGHDAYETPLGLVTVDHLALNQLNTILNNHHLGLKTVRFDQEHALEIELPFLQFTLGNDFEILPIMMVDQRENTAQALALALFELIQSLDSTEKVLLVASTDLSHFHHQRVAQKLDKAFIDALQTGDPKQLYRAANTGKTEACGLGPTACVLETSQLLGANAITITDYRDSSCAGGDKSSVVGYVSALITREDKANV
ncbi:MAG TPA: AmmeMemoRadiSam system protein B [Anaerolineaceae bacterium]|nr:AmmeMemoRadiSam system protein B [Anaerolineaceae bacterium]